MYNDAVATLETKISLPIARLAIATSAATLLLLVSLHILSPEYDPSWRMVSEYANGKYGWVLSLMFACWGIGSWTLAFVLNAHIKTTAGKIGLGFLFVAGIGETMASVFDINHQPLHDIAGYLGILGLPIAAMLISVHLSRIQPWSLARKLILWIGNLTWVSVVLLVATFVIMIVTYMQSGAQVDPQVELTALPAGVIGWVGWANRLLVVIYCTWVIIVARQATKAHEQS